MPKPRSRVQKNRREYSGEEHTTRLVEWLNGGRMTKGRRRVFRILELWHSMLGAWHVETTTKDGEVVARRYRQTPSFEEKLRELQAILFRYKFYPMAFPFPSWTSVHWFPATGRDPEKNHGWQIDYNDWNAVFDIAQLGEMELLGRLRMCSCGKWIFSRFSHQRFCSAKCREDAFHSSEEWKRKRRDKAREYYRLHKTGKVK